MQELKGMGVAMVTPFTAEGQIDFSGLERLVNHLITNGTDYLVVQGTTGESPTLSSKEKQTVLDFVKEINKNRRPIVFGIGGNNSSEIAHSMTSFDLSGVSAILSVSPYYSKPTQEGIFHHYKYLNEKSNLPIILYNVPGRTGSNVLPETVKRIETECKMVIGIKEAAGNIEQYMTLLQNRREDFLIISGDDTLVLPVMACGADGVISVVGNAYPKEFSQMVRYCASGDFASARKIHYSLLQLIHHLFMEGNPGGIKEVLQNLSICENHMRLPLYPVSEDLKKKIYRLMAEL